MGKNGIKLPLGVREFVKKVKKEYNVTNLILFGSQVSGETLKDSDYDFLVVSPDFGGMRFTERCTQVTLRTDPDFIFDFLCYTPEEFAHKKKQVGIVKEAVKTGVAL